MKKIAENTPSDVWIEEFEAVKEGKFKLKGKAFSFAAVGNFMLHFNSIPFVKSVQLEEVKHGEKEKETLREMIARSFRLSGEIVLKGKK